MKKTTAKTSRTKAPRKSAKKVAKKAAKRAAKTAKTAKSSKTPRPSKAAMAAATAGQPPSTLIDRRIEELGDWRGEALARIRALIHEADPLVVEEWKWGNVPVFSHDGIICTGETYTNVVKLTFLKGASLKDPSRIFNSSLDGNARRAIDFREGDAIDAAALMTLIRDAVALNTSSAGARQAKKR